MGITINGAGNPNTRPMMAGSLTMKNTNDPLARMGAMRKTAQKVKKPLNYNHRELSGQLLRAKKAQSASTALTRAKGKLAVLQRAAGSGQYDEKEIANAIAHARRMVRCAQLKVRNLRQEEQEQRAHRSESGAEEQQKKSEVKRRVATKERELEQKIAMARQQAGMVEKRQRNEMAQKRRAHRNQEYGKISEADMKYIKAELEAGRMPGGSGFSGASGVIMDLSSTAAAMSEIAMMEQQIQSQAEMEVEAEIAMEMAGMDMSGAAAPGMTSGGGVSVDSGAAAGSVDISI